MCIKCLDPIKEESVEDSNSRQQEKECNSLDQHNALSTQNVVSTCFPSQNKAENSLTLPDSNVLNEQCQKYFKEGFPPVSCVLYNPKYILQAKCRDIKCKMLKSPAPATAISSQLQDFYWESSKLIRYVNRIDQEEIKQTHYEEKQKLLKRLHEIQQWQKDKISEAKARDKLLKSYVAKRGIHRSKSRMKRLLEELNKKEMIKYSIRKKVHKDIAYFGLDFSSKKQYQQLYKELKDQTKNESFNGFQWKITKIGNKVVQVAKEKAKSSQVK